MLALNSYGLQQRPYGNQQQSQAPRLSLPRLVLGGSVGSSHVASHSLTKLDHLRTPSHPLYQTTTGYDYGRYLDFKDMALSCPKHAKASGFTKEFPTGPYVDTSLASIDKSKQRAECWELKVAERTKRMQIQYEELQQALEVKKSERRRVRERRRHELEAKKRAAIVIQACFRGFRVRRARDEEIHKRHTVAAIKIQQQCRARAQIRQAKELLEAKRHEHLEAYVIKMQRIGRKYLLRTDAKRELVNRRENRLREQEENARHDKEERDDAARDIQRVLRGHMARKINRSFSSSSSSGSSADKEDKTYFYSGRQRSKVAARRTLVALSVRRKRDKSVQRISLTGIKP